jgi:predicted tellurium resistance membrane protein TerC
MFLFTGILIAVFGLVVAAFVIADFAEQHWKD